MGDVSESTATENAATVIIGQRVWPEYESEFISWQHDLNETASHYPGFLGAEVTAPTRVLTAELRIEEGHSGQRDGQNCTLLAGRWSPCVIAPLRGGPIVHGPCGASFGA